MSDAFEKADRRVHRVEFEWHYPILTKHGYKPLDQTGIGFVRSYRYANAAGDTIQCTTGYNADTWEHLPSRKGGYWRDLEPFLQRQAGT